MLRGVRRSWEDCADIGEAHLQLHRRRTLNHCNYDLTRLCVRHSFAETGAREKGRPPPRGSALVQFPARGLPHAVAVQVAAAAERVLEVEPLVRAEALVGAHAV